ncbi:MAG: LLM class F420-dependent oxidoreductase [Chloroflexi bacterium]|nr:LLM class F420-dependent oxidoreductase [Chloroflexota bacterium]MCY3696322.1 LLM class F420-dependent oxidoreductase [Chloroflexota bacterium]
MATDLTLGAVLPTNEIGGDPSAIRDYAQAVEGMGFDHLLIYDHVLGADPSVHRMSGPYTDEHPFHEVFVTLGFIAACTRDLGLATAVVILPQRQTVLVAKQAAQLAVLSNNRFRLGVGSGWNQVEYEALNENFRNRGRRQEEQIELMRQLWNNHLVDFEGEFHKVTAAGIEPRPSEPIPVWFGGAHDLQLRRAAKIGDGWFPVGAPNADSAAMVDAIKGYLRENGRDPAGFGIEPQAQIRGGNPELWVSHAQRWADLGATAISIATMNAGLPDIDAHIEAVRQYREAVTA